MRRLIKLNGGGNIRKHFNQMFKTARQQGMKYFNFNGKKYSTKMNMGEGKKDTVWEKLNDNAYDLDAGINSFMIPTVDQDKQRTGTTGQISQPEATSAPLRYYNNEFEQASNYANQATNAGESTKTIPGEWQPVLPEADRADFETNEEYKQGYINKQQDNTSQNAEDGNYAFSYLRARNEKDGGKLRKKLISKIK